MTTPDVKNYFSPFFFGKEVDLKRQVKLGVNSSSFTFHSEGPPCHGETSSRCFEICHVPLRISFWCQYLLTWSSVRSQAAGKMTHFRWQELATCAETYMERCWLIYWYNDTSVLLKFTPFAMRRADTNFFFFRRPLLCFHSWYAHDVRLIYQFSSIMKLTGLTTSSTDASSIFFFKYLKANRLLPVRKVFCKIEKKCWRKENILNTM